MLQVASGKESLDGSKLNALNEALIRSERVLTRPEGLPNRDWYKHQIYAPGFYTGYGVKTLPGIREGMEQRAWDEPKKFIPLVVSAIDKLAAQVERAAVLVAVR